MEKLQESFVKLASFIYDRMMEMGSPVGGSETSLSVGWGGDIPVFPPIAILLAVIAGLLLTVVLGRNRFLPAPFKYLFIRVPLFAMSVAAFLSLIELCSNAMATKDTGPNFTEVKGVVNTGPFALTRNPIYAGVFATVAPGFAILTDSLNVVLTMSGVAYYIHTVVIPAEEKLMDKIFGARYDAYKKETPRYFKIGNVEL